MAQSSRPKDASMQVSAAGRASCLPSSLHFFPHTALRERCQLGFKVLPSRGWGVSEMACGNIERFWSCFGHLRNLGHHRICSFSSSEIDALTPPDRFILT
jgi:hypothetical protein